MSGVTVGDGGLAKAAADICGTYGISLNISGISSSYIEEDTTKILFEKQFCPPSFFDNPQAVGAVLRRLAQAPRRFVRCRWCRP